MGNLEFVKTIAKSYVQDFDIQLAIVNEALMSLPLEPAASPEAQKKRSEAYGAAREKIDKLQFFITSFTDRVAGILDRPLPLWDPSDTADAYALAVRREMEKAQDVAMNRFEAAKDGSKPSPVASLTSVLPDLGKMKDLALSLGLGLGLAIILFLAVVFLARAR